MTNDLLMDRAIPPITGFSKVLSNMGQLQNTGFELTLNANIMRRKNFEWSATGNFSLNRRKIKHLYGNMKNILDADGNIIGQVEDDDITNKWFIGEDPDRIWDYVGDGVWQQDEAEEAAKYGCQPGDFKYLDFKGNWTRMTRNTRNIQPLVSVGHSVTTSNCSMIWIFHLCCTLYGVTTVHMLMPPTITSMLLSVAVTISLTGHQKIQLMTMHVSVQRT